MMGRPQATEAGAMVDADLADLWTEAEGRSCTDLVCRAFELGKVEGAASHDWHAAVEASFSET